MNARTGFSDATTSGDGESISEEAASVGIVLAAHAPVGDALAAAATGILGRPLDDLRVVDLPRDGARASMFDTMADAVRDADRGRGVLLLTDLFGGSAANLALAQLDQPGVEVVTGANLAMLLEALDAQRQAASARALAEQVAVAARASVVVAAELLDTRGRADADHASA